MTVSLTYPDVQVDRSLPRAEQPAGANLADGTDPLVEVTLRDGTPALLWPLLPTDRNALREGFSELSPASRQQRFLVPLAELSESMLGLLVDGVDGSGHVALVLTVLPEGGEPRAVGVGRLVRYPDDPEFADVAVTVLDDWQGRGVAGALLQALLARRPAGVRALRTIVSEGNTASLAMLSRLGRLTFRPDGCGVLEVEVHDLATPPTGVSRSSAHPSRPTPSRPPAG